VRRQEGSDGWRVAQVRDVISGWAGEVIGDIVERVAGRVVLFGKRIGDVNGLLSVRCVIGEDRYQLTDSSNEPFQPGCRQFRTCLAKEGWTGSPPAGTEDTGASISR
jgi:hypothetical protein